MRVVDEIAAERRRQITEEGYDPAHDDLHGPGDLAKAGGCYAVWTASRNYGQPGQPVQWPWSPHDFKPKDRRADLIKAGALIAAAVDCMDRISPPAPLGFTLSPLAALLYTLERDGMLGRRDLEATVERIAADAGGDLILETGKSERAAWAAGLAEELQ